MNIFYLNHDPVLCAQAHCDKHVVKMCLEYAQLLSTTHRLIDGEEKTVLQKGRRLKKWILPDYREEILYAATHRNHPSAVWARASHANYKWLYRLFIACCKEYKFRYDKVHLCETKLAASLMQCPHNIASGNFTEPTPAMPADWKDQAKNSIDAYRTYYNCDKRYSINMTWKNRPSPEWFSEY